MSIYRSLGSFGQISNSVFKLWPWISPKVWGILKHEMTFRKGVEKLYNMQKVWTVCKLNIVNERLTRPQTTRFGLFSNLGVNIFDYWMHLIVCNRILFATLFAVLMACWIWLFRPAFEEDNHNDKNAISFFAVFDAI